jgi:hypothetical protein
MLDGNLLSLCSTSRHRCPMDAMVRSFLDDLVPCVRQRVDAGQAIHNPPVECVEADPQLWAVTPATTQRRTIRLVPTSTRRTPLA